MSSSARPCAVQKCETSSCAVCHCCQTDLCLDHLKEHKDNLNNELVPLANQVNTLLDSLEHFDPATSPNFVRLEEWRAAAHATVDRYYQNRHARLLEQATNEPRAQLQTIRNTVEQLIRRQGATRESIVALGNDLRLVEEKTTQLRNPTINLQPLVINGDNTIRNCGPRKAQQQAPNQVESSVDQDDLQALQNGSAFQIFVTTQLFPERQMFLAVKPSDTILQVKRKIQAKSGLPPEQQKLTFMGKQLRDHLNIATYGITRHNTLDMLRMLPERGRSAEKT